MVASLIFLLLGLAFDAHSFQSHTVLTRKPNFHGHDHFHTESFTRKKSKSCKDREGTGRFSQKDSSNDLNNHLRQLYEFLGAGPVNTLRIHTNDAGVRGIYMNHSVRKDDVLLRIPLSSCLRDDQPPSWFERHEGVAWSTCLAACLLDIQYKNYASSTNKENIEQGQSIWWEHMLMPQAKLLKQSLPIHWDEKQLAYTNCRALELAIDSAYFSRAEALADLKVLSSSFLEDKEVSNDLWNDHCQSALDFVQTRCCGITLGSDGSRLRVLAPIFDLLNHASGEGQNAEFMLEEQKDGQIQSGQGDHLIVRSLRDIKADEEVTISYGDENAKPWKCLVSYGFVPPFDNMYATADLCINGVWGEVSTGNIPFQLMEEVHGILRNTEADDTDEIQLTPAAAMHLADSAEDMAIQLEKENDDVTFGNIGEHCFEAKRLRNSQIKLLKNWSSSLQDYATSSAS